MPSNNRKNARKKSKKSALINTESSNTSTSTSSSSKKDVLEENTTTQENTSFLEGEVEVHESSNEDEEVNENGEEKVAKEEEKKTYPNDNKGREVKFILNMIVRDEKSNIIKCFNTVRHLIDAIVICDTGSVDNTIELMTTYMKDQDLPGKIVERKWTNDFGKNRTEAVRYAEEFVKEHDPDFKCVYYMCFMDADNTAHGPGGKGRFQLTKEQKNALVEDCYDVEMRTSSSVYNYPWLMRLDTDYWLAQKEGKSLDRPEKRWKWYDPRHEFPAAEGPWKEVHVGISGGYVHSGRTGCRSKNPLTYLEDSFAFLRQMKEEPKNARAVFYCAQSMKDCGQPRLAKTLYKQRVEMGGWNEEVYQSLMYIGQTRWSQQKYDQKTVEIFLKACNACPNRLEAPYYLVHTWNQQKRYTLAWRLAQAYLEVVPPSGSLFLDLDITDWRFNIEASVSAFYSGDIPKFKELSMKVLNHPRTPKPVKELAKKNLSYLPKEERSLTSSSSNIRGRK